jgi:flagellar biosynthesis anti-sigma factor FlgM
MRIDPQNPATQSSGASGVDNAQAGQVRGTPKNAGTETTDTVQLSSDQATVRQLVSQLGQVPDVREGPVSSLRSAISSGTYSPSDAQVAGALATQLLGVSE